MVSIKFGDNDFNLELLERKIDEELKKYNLSKVDYEDILSMIFDKKTGVLDIDWQDILLTYNIPLNKDSLRKSNDSIFGGFFVNLYKQFKDLKKESSKSKNDEVVEKTIETKINSDGSLTSNKLIRMNEEESKDEEFLLKMHGFNPSLWQIHTARNTIRQAISSVDGVVNLYASFITVKPSKKISTTVIKELFDELKLGFQPFKIKTLYNNIDNTSNPCMLEIPLFDVHYGKFARTEDVKEPYNFKLAEERFLNVITDVIEKTKGYNIEKVIFPIGNDFFHYDNYNITTTSGTKQDTDLSPQLLFKEGVKVLIKAITLLKTHFPCVELFCINGNHDFLTSYHALISLDCYFNGDDNIIINTETSPRKYIRYGNNLLGFTHGDKEKSRINTIMQVEARKDWGETLYHEFHLGHLHSEQVTEIAGLIIRNLPSITGTDNWHHTSGFVGALKKCQCFIWDKNYGLSNIFNIFV